MSREFRVRFWVELSALVGTAALLVVTLIWRDWIELVFDADPDGGSGSLEWLLVSVCGAIIMVALVLASREWRRSLRVDRIASTAQVR